MRKVKMAFLHNNLQIPGISQDCGKALNPSDPQSKINARGARAELWWDGEGLEVRVSGRSVLVPAANVASLEFEQAEGFASPTLKPVA